MTDLEQNAPKKSRKRISLIVIIAVLAILIIGSLIWLYTGNLSQAKINVFTKLPLPVALVNSQLITSPQLMNRIGLASKLLEGKGGADNSAKSQVFDQLIESKKVDALAASYKLSVNIDEIDKEYTNVIQQYAGGDAAKFKSDLKDTYGLTDTEFKQTVLRQNLLQGKLAVWHNEQESLNQDAYKTAKDLMGKLNSGQSFDDVAKSYTQDEATKDFAGDSGFVAFSDLLPEFQAALKDAAPGDTKQVASRYGLHIIKVLEKDNGGDNNSARIHIQQIFIKQSDFNQWFKQQTDSIKVTKFRKI